MTWQERFPKDKQPTMAEVAAYVATPLWGALCTLIEERYGSKPKLSYSGCSMAPGWNVKYQKKGRAICTLYPDAGSFSCLILVPERVFGRAEVLLPTCTETVQRRYWEQKPSMGGRWLMLEVADEATLADVRELIGLRCDEG